MAEVSYPFSESNESGGQTTVSDAQWQAMASVWGGDRVDFTLTAEAYSAASLPFYAAVINLRQIEISPGNAWVGGFYYQLTANAIMDIESNPTDQARKDTIVLRADIPKGSVNLAVVKGQPSNSPVAPQPQRVPGQKWEMVLHEVTVPARNGSPQASGRAPYGVAPSVYVPWNARPTADFQPRGTFIYDMDNNGGGSQAEAFVGRDGYAYTMHLGKAARYSPSLVNTSSAPSGLKFSGQWRWIAPNTVKYSILVDNTTSSPIKNTQGTDAIGVRLPQVGNGFVGQTQVAQLRNPNYNNGLPNFMMLQGIIFPGSDHITFYYLNDGTPAPGDYDTLRLVPAKSQIWVSGVYEANIFNE